MSRLIFVPQYPAKLRYQEWWFQEFPKHFRKHFDEVLVLGEHLLKSGEFYRGRQDSFSPIKLSIDFETELIREYYRVQIDPSDTLFLADISFPGLFSNVLYHKPCQNSYAFCHASALNAYDYWQPVRKYKWKVECQHSRLFKKIFVGTNYHQRKLGWYNTSVVGLPNPPFIYKDRFPEEKSINLISVSRPSIQKVNKKLEKQVEKRFGKIVRTPDMGLHSWATYYKFLLMSKIMVITSKEETWGYQVIDAILNDVIPLAPNKYSYPELLPQAYLYDNDRELLEMIDHILEYDDVRVPEIRCQERINTFYDRVCNVMKGS